MLVTWTRTPGPLVPEEDPDELPEDDPDELPDEDPDDEPDELPAEAPDELPEDAPEEDFPPLEEDDPFPTEAPPSPAAPTGERSVPGVAPHPAPEASAAAAREQTIARGKNLVIGGLSSQSQCQHPSETAHDPSR